jgi:GT2 family glycosyltransferase
MYGKNPEWWITLDDDTVVGEMTIPNLIDVCAMDDSLGLIGAWNDHSERTPERGNLVRLGDHTVQYDKGGNPFCVGGALHMIPKRALDRVGPYADMPRHEDAEYSERIRLSGMSAVLVRTIPVAVLPDDQVVASYRDRIKAMHYGGWDPRADRK